MFGLTLSLYQKLIAIGLFMAWSMSCFVGGFVYKWHLVSVEQSAERATQTTANTVAEAASIASDTVQVKTLETQLAAATSREATLQKRIKELSSANPADLTCRIPDGLREAINSNFLTP